METGKKEDTQGDAAKCITPSHKGPHRTPGAWRNILADSVPTKKKKKKNPLAAILEG